MGFEWTHTAPPRGRVLSDSFSFPCPFNTTRTCTHIYIHIHVQLISHFFVLKRELNYMQAKTAVRCSGKEGRKGSLKKTLSPRFKQAGSIGKQLSLPQVRESTACAREDAVTAQRSWRLHRLRFRLERRP